jgi:hypothetical protein
MDAHPLDNDFAFPALATRALNDNEIASDTVDFSAGEEPLGIFRGLVAAVVIQIGIALLGILGWQLWQWIR